MFETMRRNTKLIMWITTGAFVLLIFLAWGAEYQGFGKKRGPQAGVVGTVNGDPILYNTYLTIINQTREQQQQQGQALDEAMEVTIRDQAWKSLVQQALVNQEIKRLSITVSDKEIVEAIRTQPLPMIMQSPDFQTDGKFDYSKYLAALSDPNRDWTPLEAYYRQDLPKQKVQELVMASAKVSDADVRRQFETDNTKAKVAYVYLPAGRFKLDATSLEESAVRSYYDSHKDDYRTEAQGWVQYVRIDKKPAPSDTTSAKDLIQQAAKEAASGEEFGTLVSAYSEAQKQLRGGADGIYMTKDQYPSPSVREAAFALPVGQVSGILTESNGYHLIRVEDRRMNGDKEEAKIADIFVPISLSPESVTGYRDRASSLLGAAREEQGDLASAAEKDGLTVTNTGPFGRKTGFVPGLSTSSGFMDWVFNSPVGKLTAMETPEAWFVIRLAQRRDAGVAPFDEVKDRTRQDYAASLQVEQAGQHAEQILALVRGGTSMEQAAKSDTTASFGQTDEFAQRGFVRGLGNDPVVMAHAFYDPLGLVPKVVSTKRGAYLLDILSRVEPDSTQLASQRDQLRKQIIQRRRTDIINRWMADMQARAKIEDYRTDSEL